MCTAEYVGFRCFAVDTFSLFDMDTISMQGARIGDVVRAIDGQDMTGRRAFEVRGKLLGAAGTSVVVTLQRFGLCLCDPGVDECDCMGMFDLELTR
jgi:hypothetical protein